MTCPGNTAPISVPCAASMSTPLRYVRVPKRGCTWAPKAATLLLVLELPDERFQPLGRLAQLPHHALVIGTVFPDPGQQGPALGRLAVDLELLPVGVHSQG